MSLQLEKELLNPEALRGAIVYAQDDLQALYKEPIENGLGVYELEVSGGKGYLRLLKTNTPEDVFTQGLENEQIDLEALVSRNGNLGYAVLCIKYLPTNYQMIGSDLLPTFYRRVDALVGLAPYKEGILDLLLANPTSDPWVRVQ